MTRPRQHASNADRQRAYRERERKRNGGVTKPKPPGPAGQTSFSEAQLLQIALEGWKREFAPNILEQLLRVAELGGRDAALYAASAVRRALDEERGWAALRQWDATHQGYRLKFLIERKDERVRKFLEECHI